MSRTVIRGDAGTSLSEVFFAITIFGIVTANLVPALSHKRMEINTAERMVLSHLRIARGNAITRNVHYLVEFPSATQIRVSRMAENADGQWQVDPAEVRTIALPSATSFSADNVGDSFEFDTRGIVVNLSEPVRIELADPYGSRKTVEAWPSGQINEA